jgi:hypothetical protein
MKTSPATLDFSKAILIAPSPVERRARALEGALFYAAQQDPDQYARLLRLQVLTGIPPAVSAGNEKQIEQMLDVNSIDR